MANPQNAPPCCTVDPYDHLQLVRNPDGSINRPHIPNAPVPSDADADADADVLIKDVQLNPQLGTWLRLHLPRQPPETTSSGKLPVIVYYHGGGFILFSAFSVLIHDFCSEMAVHLSAAVVSVEYRLAPEHRLPAAYEDAVEALRWLKRADDAWLRDFADVSRCFVMGTSAGANIAYQAGLRAASMGAVDLEPVKIRGLILHHPFFGGSKRTGSELRLVNDQMLPLSSTDLMWELALPIGVDRDHEYCNPTAGKGRGQFDGIKGLGWRFLVTGGDGDPLIDRQREAAEIMKGEGVEVVTHFVEGDHHGIDVVVPEKTKALFGILKTFIKQSS